MKAKEQAKEKAKAAEQGGLAKKKLRRKYITTPNTNKEIEDTSQFRAVSHPPKSKADKICHNIRDHADISELKNIDIGKLPKKRRIILRFLFTP